MENKQEKTIDIVTMLKILWQRRKVFYWVLPITFVVSSALILCVPRYYTTSVVLAPETENNNDISSLEPLLSNFGIGIGSMSRQDAIYPQIYPKVFESPDFLTQLFATHVETNDGEFSGTYYEYITTHQKLPFWNKLFNAIKHLFASKEEMGQGGRPDAKKGNVEVFWLNRQQLSAVEKMKKDIICVVDKTPEIVSITVSAQDKLVCAMVADAVCVKLQHFMTDYRTQKAQVDIKYYEAVTEEAQREYTEAVDAYVSFVDAHSDLSLEKYKVESQKLSSEMETKFMAYSSFQKQYMVSQARLQEATPVFTVIKSASVPFKPAGPKRMIFVTMMVFLAFIVTIVVIAAKDMHLFG